MRERLDRIESNNMRLILVLALKDDVYDPEVNKENLEKIIQREVYALSKNDLDFNKMRLGEIPSTIVFERFVIQAPFDDLDNSQALSDWAHTLLELQTRYGHLNAYLAIVNKTSWSYLPEIPNEYGGADFLFSPKEFNAPVAKSKEIIPSF